MAEHLCVVCPQRRDGDPATYLRAYVCDSCRTWLETLPPQIVSLWRRLSDQDPPDDPIAVLRETSQRLGKWTYDPIADALPAGPIATLAGQPVTGGGTEAPIPIDLDPVDLTAPAARLPLPADYWWEDQIGHLSVAMTLDLIVREWADALDVHLPTPTVPALADWIVVRTPWACDQHPGVDQAAAALRRLRTALRAQVGDLDPLPEPVPTPCPGCDQRTLVRTPGRPGVECAGAECRRILTEPEYAAYVARTVPQERPARPVMPVVVRSAPVLPLHNNRGGR